MNDEQSNDPANGSGGAAQGEYEVGYKRPPRHSAFVKGQVANPDGRRGKSKNIRKIMEGQLDEPVQIRQGRKVSTYTKREAVLVRLLERAIKADHSATGQLLKLLRELGLLDDEPDVTPEEIRAEDQAIIADFLRRQLAESQAAPAHQADPEKKQK